MKRRIPAIPAFFAVLVLAAAPLAAEQAKENWVNFFDAGKGLWAKKDLVSGEILYLSRYGESPDMVSFLKEEEISAVEARKTLERIAAAEKDAHSRGFGDSLFRPAASVGEAVKVLEDTGWSVKAYETDDRIYGKKHSKSSVKLPRALSREMRGQEFFSALAPTGIAIYPAEVPPAPRTSKSVAKNRNK